MRIPGVDVEEERIVAMTLKPRDGAAERPGREVVLLPHAQSNNVLSLRPGSLTPNPHEIVKAPIVPVAVPEQERRVRNAACQEPGFAQDLRQRDLPFGERPPVERCERVAACEDVCPRRHRREGAGVAVLKDEGLAREGVQLRCEHGRVSITGEVIPPERIGNDQNDIHKRRPCAAGDIRPFAAATSPPSLW